ncbi:MAG: ATP-binding protein [Opitutales bacterium]
MESSTQQVTMDAENLGILTDFVESEKLPTCSFKPGEVILDQNAQNKHLYVILSGVAELTRESKSHGGRKIFVDILGPGSFLGLISFWSGRPTHSKSVAVDDVTCLLFTPNLFDKVREQFSKFSKTVDHLLIGNLCERVQRMAAINAENAELSIALENERNHLKETLRELEETRERLAHSERLAVMGQLVAGVAHEINNPASALRQSIEGLQECSKQSLESSNSKNLNSETALGLYQLGIDQSQPDASAIRARLKSLEKDHPQLPRSLLRRLASLPESPDLDLNKLLKRSLTSKPEQRISEALNAYETGAYLKTAQLTTERIFGLVKSLKRYGKPENTTVEDTDILTCIRDTRTVLNHRLKYYDLRIELNELPKVRIAPGEFNQVITNLLVNAMDATPEGKKIALGATFIEGKIQIKISDAGTGIPEQNLERIFEPNFTTKNSSQHFGLGLGLALSKEIIEQYGGTLSAKNIPESGACFTIELPEVIPDKPGK